MVNEAAWAPGTFSIEKNVEGVELSAPGVPHVVNVTATWVGEGELFTKDLSIPTDGTLVELGEDLPHGTEVMLTEHKLEGAPAFTWLTPEWNADGIVVHDDGTATLTIGAAQNISVGLTNTALATLGSLSVEKAVTGAGASQVPVATTYPVTATWTDLLGDEQQVEFDLVAGTPAKLDALPLGTKVTFTEGETRLPGEVSWDGASWSTDSADATIEGEGRSVVVTVVGDAGTAAQLVLENEIGKKPELAVTGGGLAMGALLAAGIAVAVGLLLMRRRVQ